ncbi:hypothetical protein JOB18_017648 [Solea senegalensis]|uniref:Uncharacterized protein n=1 Tax=Solea senegalensis TaxID=28829 RepID=A0AAV6RAA6_SOLSE|nr:hypothetical protein JOB18_017648 [Solea senegalensis]
MGLQGDITPFKAKKKWDNLKKKYKDCKCPGSGEGVSGKPTAATWPWYVHMDEVLGQKHSIAPPVLITSIPEDRPGPSSAVSERQEGGEEEEEVQVPRPRRHSKKKRDWEGELVDLLRRGHEETEGDGGEEREEDGQTNQGWSHHTSNEVTL